MIYIRDLTESEKQRIVDALNKDGFENVEVHDSYIEFNKRPRFFQLCSLNIHEEYNLDLGLNIFLEEDYFFSDKQKSKEETVNFSKQEKVRHSTSLSQKSDSDISSTVDELNWDLENQYDFTSDENFFSKPDKSTELLHLSIREKPHFALNHGDSNSYQVYEGDPQIFLDVLREHPDNFFDAPELKLVLKTIRDEREG